MTMPYQIITDSSCDLPQELADSYGLIGSSRFLRPLALGSDQSGNRQVVSWGEKSVSWYFPGAENGHVWQNNTKDYVYHYVAIGYDAK